MKSFSIFILALLLLVAGCGGWLGSGDAHSVEWLSDEVRLAAVEAVEDAFDALPGTNEAADNAALLAFIQTRPEFEASGLSDDGCVWARFTDGILLIVANNRKPPENGGLVSSPVESDGGRAPTELPSSEDVRYLNAMGTLYSDPTPNAQPMISNGYRIISTDVTVDGLKNVYGNDGVFYIDSHGGTGTSTRGSVYSVSTGTKFAFSTASTYMSELRAGRLNLMTANFDAPVPPGTTATSETRYAITPAFVRKYMRFSGNCFVFVDACNSDNTSFKQAMLDRGASVYAGWTNTVRDDVAINAGAYLFRRMASSQSARPAVFPTIKTEMSQMSPRLDLDPGSGAELVFTANTTSGAGDFALLAPTVSGVVPNRILGTLLLSGVFGLDPGAAGSVKVDGTQLSVTSWQPYSILCTLPATGPGSSGFVNVTVRGHVSNQAGPVPPTGGNTLDKSFFEGYYQDDNGIFIDLDGTVTQPWHWALRMSDEGNGTPAVFTTYWWNDANGVYYPESRQPVETMITGNTITAIFDEPDNGPMDFRKKVTATFTRIGTSGKRCVAEVEHGSIDDVSREWVGATYKKTLNVTQ